MRVQPEAVPTPFNRVDSRRGRCQSVGGLNGRSAKLFRRGSTSPEVGLNPSPLCHDLAKRPTLLAYGHRATVTCLRVITAPNVVGVMPTNSRPSAMLSETPQDWTLV